MAVLDPNDWEYQAYLAQLATNGLPSEDVAPLDANMKAYLANMGVPDLVRGPYGIGLVTPEDRGTYLSTNDMLQMLPPGFVLEPNIVNPNTLDPRGLGAPQIPGFRWPYSTPVPESTGTPGFISTENRGYTPAAFAYAADPARSWNQPGGMTGYENVNRSAGGAADQTATMPSSLVGLPTGWTNPYQQSVAPPAQNQEEDVQSRILASFGSPVRPPSSGSTLSPMGTYPSQRLGGMRSLGGGIGMGRRY